MIKNNRKAKDIETADNKDGNEGIEVLKTVIARVYTILIVNFGWVLFRADGIENGITYMKSMLGMSEAVKPMFSVGWYLDKWTLCILVLALFGTTDIPKKIWMWITKRMNIIVQISIKYVLLLMILLLSVMRIVSGTYNPFIYFQF